MANKLNINPTRQELLKLKVRLKSAERGYKLLKQKRDGLMKAFMAIIREAKVLRTTIEKDLGQGFQTFLFASAQTRPELMSTALVMPSKKVTLEADTKNVMSVNIPQFTFKEEGNFAAYSLATTPSELDASLTIFNAALKDMIKLAEIEHSARLLAEEIEKTRRRVNALEYVFIPNMEETIKYIESKLGEQERGTLITLMKVKDIIAKQEAAQA
ncbi:MAG: V-type ATP synthase subunit D [Candidatus Buchananbacteria bacterium CG10_big_fil_rev_8_21_14_0_10_42_9]|uniref:V-type ATP synthase subunit D n=1 Tax=Candidatus Buchananbacteria bacterium CG10_big_fil_rev_8_21_14_0_10_42_9 TaxID=1974526 RepID=A0A2H0W0T8_9BACT|nr:MAG: V-type ATP synthase subunit D [Candidatus Buchananbacteria bacterium CG10_big_fil_rev_8_21_14_0_10_42_9]